MYCGDNFVTGTLVFSAFIDAYTFCRENVHCLYLEIKNYWLESYSGKIASYSLRKVTTELNNDCVDEIAKRLDVLRLADLLSVKKGSQLIRIAREILLRSSCIRRYFNKHYNLYSVIQRRCKKPMEFQI